MQPFETQLRGQLEVAGWRVIHETRTETPTRVSVPLEWRLASVRPPLGRQVVLHFRALHVYPDDYTDWGAYFEVSVTVRFPTGLYSEGGPEETFHYLTSQNYSFRQLFRALEWFRDPIGYSLWNWNNRTAGDWDPPETWDPFRFRPGQGIDLVWDVSTAPQEMFQYARPHLSSRKLLLLACGLCRQLPVSMLNERNQLALEQAERYAEGEITRRELKKVTKPSGLPWLARLEPDEQVATALAELTKESPAAAGPVAARAVREIVPPPFGLEEFRYSWLRNDGGNVVRVARGIDLTKDFAAMPVLADALEDAGCTARRILEHCRQAEGHLRGCWVLDLVLGRK